MAELMLMGYINFESFTQGYYLLKAFEEMAVKDRERYHSEMVELLRRLKATDRTHLVSSKVLKKYST